jgi:uncharacterized protein YjbK
VTRELEIEYKNMLTEEQFDRLRQALSVDPHGFFEQSNDYLDTPDFMLKKRKYALRIRHVDGKNDLTLKQPQRAAVLETHQLLSDEESRSLIESGVLPDGEVGHALSRAGLRPNRLALLGTLTTQRAEIPYEGGTLFLDRSFYLGVQDYELEYEAQDADSGKRTFLRLLHAYGIARCPSRSKVMRLYHELKKKEPIHDVH